VAVNAGVHPMAQLRPSLPACPDGSQPPARLALFADPWALGDGGGGSVGCRTDAPV